MVGCTRLFDHRCSHVCASAKFSDIVVNHCNYFGMEVIARQNNWPEMFDKKRWPNFFVRENFYKIVLTVSKLLATSVHNVPSEQQVLSIFYLILDAL